MRSPSCRERRTTWGSQSPVGLFRSSPAQWCPELPVPLALFQHTPVRWDDTHTHTLQKKAFALTMFSNKIDVRVCLSLSFRPTGLTWRRSSWLMMELVWASGSLVAKPQESLSKPSYREALLTRWALSDKISRNWRLSIDEQEFPPKPV